MTTISVTVKAVTDITLRVTTTTEDGRQSATAYPNTGANMARAARYGAAQELGLGIDELAELTVTLSETHSDAERTYEVTI